MDVNLLVNSFIVGGLALLSFLKLTNVTGVNKKANLYFGIFAMLWATYWLDEMLFPKVQHQESVIVWGFRFVQFFVPLTFYFSVKFYTQPHLKYSPKDVRFLIAPFVFLVLLLSKSYLNPDMFQLVFISFILGHSLFYAVLAHLQIRKHQKDIELFASNIEAIDLRWIKYIIYAFISSAVIIIGYSIYSTAAALNIYINLFFLLVVYFVAYHSIKQKEIYPKGLKIGTPTVENKVDDERVKLMSDDELEKLKTALLNLMETQQPYLDSELNLVKLAEQLHISGHQLSFVLNSGLGENFFYFINKYRVQKAETLLMNPGYDHLNMLAIGFEAGFNSKTSFNTTFKKMTTYTPSEYKKIRSKL